MTHAALATLLRHADLPAAGASLSEVHHCFVQLLPSAWCHTSHGAALFGRLAFTHLQASPHRCDSATGSQFRLVAVLRKQRFLNRPSGWYPSCTPTVPATTRVCAGDGGVQAAGTLLLGGGRVRGHRGGDARRAAGGAAAGARLQPLGAARRAAVRGPGRPAAARSEQQRWEVGSLTARIPPNRVVRCCPCHVDLELLCPASTCEHSCCDCCSICVRCHGSKVGSVADVGLCIRPQVPLRWWGQTLSTCWPRSCRSSATSR